MLKAPQHRGRALGGAPLLPAAWPLPRLRRPVAAGAARRAAPPPTPPAPTPPPPPGPALPSSVLARDDDAPSEAPSPTPPPAAALTERLSNTSGSRAAASRAFLSALGVRATPQAEALASVGDPGTLASRSPFRAARLPFSSVVAQKKRPYFSGRPWVERDLGYASFFLPLHLFFFAAAPFTASPGALRCCALGFVLTGWLGVGLGYHRLLSHRAFRAARPVERALALLGALAFEGDPVEWAKMHLNHHAHSDGPGDRHSPRDGLWHSHMGWLFDSALSNARGLDAAAQAQAQQAQQAQQAAAVAAASSADPSPRLAAVGLLDATDDETDADAATAPVASSSSAPWFVRADPEFHAWLRQNYMPLQGGQLLFFALLSLGLRDPGLLVWGYAGRVLVTMHATWLVNSGAHVWGSQPFETGDDSRDNWAVALLVGGDGWHNGHHAFPRSARHGLAAPAWLDFNWLAVRGLERAGLAWEVQRPSEEMVERKRKRRKGGA